VALDTYTEAVFEIESVTPADVTLHAVAGHMKLILHIENLTPEEVLEKLVIVEKPKADTKWADFASAGGYILHRSLRSVLSITRYDSYPCMFSLRFILCLDLLNVSATLLAYYVERATRAHLPAHGAWMQDARGSLLPRRQSFKIWLCRSWSRLGRPN
jgi:UTP-glucose-1-phosphate uridylyltransferase